ncbi:MAG: HI1506-related protein [Limnochordia bacterium]|jgi:hypothetical protein
MPIRITSKKDGFWRCGVQHSSTPTIYPDDRFTPEQLEQLKAEPMLIVDVIQEEKPKTNKRAAKGGGTDGDGGDADEPKGRGVNTQSGGD